MKFPFQSWSRWEMLITIGVLLLALCVAMTGCVPVTVRPEMDDKGLPIAIPVTPSGSIGPDGTLHPIYPISTNPPSQTNWAMIGTIAGGVLSAFLAAYGINLRGAVSKLQTGLRITSDLADANAIAETDDQVQRNKAIAAHLQDQAKIRDLVNRIRKS